jgi:dihydrofolate reductase
MGARAPRGRRMKCSVFIATSLDGYIARADGGIDWLHDTYGDPNAEPEDMGFDAFISTVDGMVMGRNTFETVLGFDGWPYGDTPIAVLSSSMTEIPGGVPDTVSLSNETPTEIVARLGAEGRTHLYIDGGVTIQRFLDAGLIDEMTITRLPILLGSGIPLFGRTKTDIRFTHLSTRAFRSGLVQSVYRAER